MSLLEVSSVKKVYGKGENTVAAVSGIDLKIEKGESIAIIGKSGSGKSTLMHLLALLDTPTEGAITLDGKNTADLKRREVDLLRNKKIGFIFQQFFLNPRNSVMENIELPLKIAGLKRSVRKEKVERVLKEVDLLEKAKSKANDLSGGQKQRVAIARALVNDPEIIFADEPTGNLDSVNGKIIEDLLFKLHKERNATLIIVTHDEELASRCSHEVFLKDGKIVNERTK
jgi:putative ABC transport system ATP-binding protein